MKLVFLVVGVTALLGIVPNSAQSLNCSDATILALEISGAPLAPQELVNQVAQDVMLIRIMYPEVAGITVYPDWNPGEIVVGLTEEAHQAYQAGTFAAFDSLNTLFGGAVIHEFQLISTLFLTLGDCYHPEYLAGEYTRLEGVRYAEPNGPGGDGDDISSTQVGYYTFKHGFGDCPAGCIYEHFWDFYVSGGSVTLVDEYGYTASGVGEIPSVGPVESFEVWPNPLNPSTSIRFFLRASGPISVQVYDVGGRLVRDLGSEVLAAGEHEIQWGGESNSGAIVSSGVYFCTLKGAGWAEAKKVVVLK